MKQFILTLDGEGNGPDEEELYFLLLGAEELASTFSIRVQRFDDPSLIEGDDDVEPGNLGITEEGLAACYICGGTHSHDHPEEFLKCDVPDCIKHGPIGYGKKFYCPQHWEDFQVLWDLEGLPAALKLTEPVEEDELVDWPTTLEEAEVILGDDFMRQHEWLSDKDWKEVFDLSWKDFGDNLTDIVADFLRAEVAKFNPPEPDYDRNEDR